jgi:hypothetical protein
MTSGKIGILEQEFRYHTMKAGKLLFIGYGVCYGKPNPSSQVRIEEVFRRQTIKNVLVEFIGEPVEDGDEQLPFVREVNVE